MLTEAHKMTVRGSKNKIIIYIAGACSIAFVILLYHNASQRLETMEISYERCHLNEESLSAQLQVNLEYKIRLEKSLQLEKSNHAQTKEEFQKKLEDERKSRERENVEAVNKFSTLEKQYSLLQHQLDDVQEKYEKTKEMQLSEEKDKKALEEVVANLKKELSESKDTRKNDLNSWMVKISNLEDENSILQAQNKKLHEEIENHDKLRDQMKTNPSNVKLHNNFPLGPLFRKSIENDNQLKTINKEDVSQPVNVVKSSTAPNRIEKELFPSANSLFANISTPMINPQAVQNEDKIPIAPMPQPRQESSSMRAPNLYDVKENVVPKPDDMASGGMNGMPAVQDVLRAPDVLNQFDQVIAQNNYNKKIKEMEKNNHGGEVGDEDEALVKNVQNPIHRWRGDFRVQPLVANPVGNDIPKNQVYQYPVEDEGRKEEGEDDDDMDPLEYQNMNDRNAGGKEVNIKPEVHIPVGGRHESVMLQPK